MIAGTDLSRVGAVSAFTAAATYLLGFLVLFAWLLPAGFNAGANDLPGQVQFVVDNRTTLSLWYFVVYIVNGLFLVLLATALFYRYRRTVPVLASLSLIYGVLWAGLVLAAGMLANVGIATIADRCATDLTDCGQWWQLIRIVINGLGGGNETLGAVWLLLVAAAGFRTADLPPGLIVLGVLTGIAGAISHWPGLGEASGVVFGIGCLIWFVWIGFVLARTQVASLPGRQILMP